MATILDEKAQDKPIGRSTPAQYPRLIWVYMAIDMFFMKLFGFSLVTSSIMKKNGVADVPCLILTTTGHKTGKKREIILPYYYRDYTNGETYGVIGSNGGAPDHPHWVHNVFHEPMCEVQIGRRKFKARAHIAEAQEHELVYGTAVREYPWFKDYEVRCFPRKIRAIVVEKIQ
jgi:deazaflavin-dependent oxidoreductase (nitroreductase family)